LDIGQNFEEKSYILVDKTQFKGNLDFTALADRSHPNFESVSAELEGKLLIVLEG
jgi:hypothetical protein